MSEQRRSSSPRAKAGRNAARGNAQQQAAERKLAEQRRNRSIAQGERRTTADAVRAAEPAPTAAGRANITDSPTPSSYLDLPEGYRAGFACFVGRPNAGKSTLTNALVGAKIAITSGRPQTTRHTVRGIVHRADAQLVLVDTPGLHRPRTLLGERLNDQVRATWARLAVRGNLLGVTVSGICSGRPKPNFAACAFRASAPSVMPRLANAVLQEMVSA